MADSKSSEPSLEVARRFLDAPEIRGASEEAKTQFLQSKGVTEATIQKLLSKNGEEKEKLETKSENRDSSPKPGDQKQDNPKQSDEKQDDKRDQTQEAQQIREHEEAYRSAPPIVAYPEFLVQPARPPPLVSTSTVANLVAGLGGLATLLYGTNKYAVEPMTAELHDARAALYHNTSRRLGALTARLEKVVSITPDQYRRAPTVDEANDPPTERGNTAMTAAAAPQQTAVHGSTSVFHDMDDCEDPTELFHRDIGTQTSSNPPSPFLVAHRRRRDSHSTTISTVPAAPPVMPEDASATSEAALKQQTKSLATLTFHLHELRNSLQHDDEGLEDIRAECYSFQHQLDALASDAYADYGPGSGGGSYYGSSVFGNKRVDEMQRTRETIRRMKGILLSAQNFPAVPR